MAKEIKDPKPKSLTSNTNKEKNMVSHGNGRLYYPSEPKIIGRPPTKYTDKELIDLGERLLEWMVDCDDDPKINVVHLSEFYCKLEGYGWKEWEGICARSRFQGYYNKARAWILERTLKNQKLPTAYGSRFLGIYSPELREHEKLITQEKIELEVITKQKLFQQDPPNEKLLAQEQEILQLKAQLRQYQDTTGT